MAAETVEVVGEQPLGWLTLIGSGESLTDLIEGPEESGGGVKVGVGALGAGVVGIGATGATGTAGSGVDVAVGCTAGASGATTGCDVRPSMTNVWDVEFRHMILLPPSTRIPKRTDHVYSPGEKMKLVGYRMAAPT